MKHQNDLSKAIEQIINNREIMASYPEGITAYEMLAEIREHVSEFPLVSTLDVIDEMRELLGSPC